MHCLDGSGGWNRHETAQNPLLRLQIAPQDPPIQKRALMLNSGTEITVDFVDRVWRHHAWDRRSPARCL